MLTEGIDYADKHAGTVRWSAAKLIIAIATKFDYNITLLDIFTFFLYGECEEEMYMEIPKGWGKDGKDADSGFIFRLKKTVYGLPQASNAAQKKLKEAFFAKKEYRATSGDDCVYVSTSWGKSADDSSTKGYSVCGTHVDDIIATGDTNGSEKLIDTMEAKFKITKTINPTCITGVQVERVRGKNGWTKLHQTEYTLNFLKEQKMEGARSVDTPMDPGTAKLLMELPQDKFTKDSIKIFQDTMAGFGDKERSPLLQLNKENANRARAAKKNYQTWRNSINEIIPELMEHARITAELGSLEATISEMTASVLSHQSQLDTLNEEHAATQIQFNDFRSLVELTKRWLDEAGKIAGKKMRISQKNTDLSLSMTSVSNTNNRNLRTVERDVESKMEEKDNLMNKINRLNKEMSAINTNIGNISTQVCIPL